ncbi:LacI family DNA-binding transcriptional regulator [candidate division KSB1 bacterium]|nr:LacI family DNA-binding transcriptional regulator [candidate division KSB1 bacterium]
MATIKEIAELAHVSIGTVDRVLHNRGRVSSDTKRKVEKIIKELDYKPNLLARQLKLSRDYTFGVLMPELHQDSKYWERPALGIYKAKRELESQKINIKFFHFNRYSEASFIEKSNRLLNDHLDGLLITPILIKPARELIHKIPEDIPYVFFDSDIPDSNRLTFIGQDPYRSGMLAAKLMRLMTMTDGSIAIIRILPEDYHIDQRIEGFLHYYRENDGKKNIQIYEWKEQRDLSSLDIISQKILDEQSDLQGIFVTNALTYLIASFLEKHHTERHIRIIGYDLIDKNVDYLRSGMIDFLINQFSIDQGYQGIYSLFKHLALKQKVDDTIMMPINIVMNENIDYYYYSTDDLGR